MPSEFGYPGIPTNLQNRSKTRFDNDNLSQRQKLGIEFEQPSPSLASLYEDEPTTEELLAQAQGTLDDTALTQGGLNLAAQTGGPASTEQFAPRPETTYGDVAEDTLAAGSFVPGPVGLASRLGTGAMGAYDTVTEGPSLENSFQMGAPLFDAIPAIRSLRNSSRLKNVNVGAHGPANAPMQGAARPPMPYKFNDNIARSRTAPSGVDDVGVSGIGTDDILRRERHRRAMGVSDTMIGADDITQSSAVPASMQALGQSDDVAASASPFVDLTGALDELGGASLSPQDIARARAAERFGKTYRSESTGGQPDQSGLRRIITSMFGDNPSPSVSRMTAAEALADDSVIGMTKAGKPITASSVEQSNPLFGGASAREYGSGPEAGEFVRPKNRKPIGKKPSPPWRLGREEAIAWNP